MADLLINAKITGGKETAKALGDINEAAKKAASSIDSFQNETKKSQGITNKSIQEAAKLSAKLNELALSEKAVNRGLKELNSGLISSTTFTNRYGKAVNNLRSEIKNSYGQNLKYEKSIDSVTESLKRAREEEKKLADSQSNLAGLFKTVKAAAIGYATVIATMEIQQFITNTITAGIELDSLQRSFKAITGSAYLANQEMAFVAKTSKDLGLELVTLEKSYKDILAASKGTSLEGEGVQKVFTAINKAAAVLGMTSDDTQGSLRALSQMISKSNVQAEELIKSITYKILSVIFGSLHGDMYRKSVLIAGTSC